MNYFNDIVSVNKEALLRTLKKIYFVPILAIVLLVMRFAEIYITSLLITNVQSMNFLLGFVRYMIRIVFMSAVISVLEDVVLYDRFDINRVLNGYKDFISPVSQTMFVLYIARLLISMFVGSLGIDLIDTILELAILVVMSVLYEEIYIGGRSGTDLFTSAFDFLKSNILHWLIVLVLYVLVERNFDHNIVRILFDFKQIVFAFLVSMASAFIYMYKGHLFSILDESSMRKRYFQGKFR